MNDRNAKIIAEYTNDEMSPAELSIKYDISARQVQRIITKWGEMRSISESFKLAIKRGRMTYYRKPEHLKSKRLTLPLSLRYKVLESANGRCILCGNAIEDGIRLEIDHIDGNPSNNSITNLQVLCNLCNKGKN